MAISPSAAANLPPLYAALGQSLSQWAEFEDEVFLVFKAMMGNSHEVCLAVFYSTNVFAGRLALANAVATAALARKGELAHWKDLFRLADVMRVERNFIAHNPIRVTIAAYDHDEKGVRIRMGPGALVSASFESEFKKRQGQKRATAEVEQFANEVTVLKAHWKRFREHLLGEISEECRCPLVEPRLSRFVRKR